MAEGIVEVTAGSGTKLHSWSKTVGANTVHDEFTLPGEYPLASYFIYATAISVATTSDHVLQIMAGSSLKVRIRRISIEQLNSASAANLQSFTLIRLTTAGSGGTSVTPRPFDTADSAASCTAMTLPSSKGTEGVTLWGKTLALRQAIATTATQPEETLEWQQHPNTPPIIIPAGTSNGICIKIGTGVSTATVNVIVEVTETSF